MRDTAVPPSDERVQRLQAGSIVVSDDRVYFDSFRHAVQTDDLRSRLEKATQQRHIVWVAGRDADDAVGIGLHPLQILGFAPRLAPYVAEQQVELVRQSGTDTGQILLFEKVTGIEKNGHVACVARAGRGHHRSCSSLADDDPLL